MTELRRDYILERYVIVASGRGKRPHEFMEPATETHVGTDFFAPGNEHLTPPEIGRIGDEHGWRIRWFANKFQAVDQHGVAEMRTDNEFFTFANAVGHHEIIVETPDPTQQLHELPPDRIFEILKVWSDRVDSVTSLPHVKYAMLFKNHGPKAGTSIRHSHSQLIGYNMVPTLVREEVEAVKMYGTSPYSRIIEIEKGSDRRCIENDTMVSFTPYASRFPFEVWIFPKRYVKMLHELNPDEFMDLAKVLHTLLERISRLNASYNLVLRHAPPGEELHLHIELIPRLSTMAGFELGTDTIINTMPPEEAAAFYRGES